MDESRICNFTSVRGSGDPILKTIAIIRMIHKEEELPAKEDISDFHWDVKKRISTCNAKTHGERFIIYRKRLGVYAFRSNVGVDIEKAIESRMGEMESRFDLCRSLMDSAEMDYELPKRYNQKFAITRYFQYEIIRFRIS